MGAINRPISTLEAITTSDTNTVTKNHRGLYVGVSGDVVLVMQSGETVTLKALAAGVWHPIMNIAKIKATGTTATDIVLGF